MIQLFRASVDKRFDALPNSIELRLRDDARFFAVEQRVVSQFKPDARKVDRSETQVAS